MIEARLPDGTTLRFPEGTDQSVIDRVVKEQLGEQPKGMLAVPAVKRGIGFLSGVEDLIQEPVINLMQLSGDPEKEAAARKYRTEREASIANKTAGVSPMWRVGGQVAGAGGGIYRPAASWAGRAVQGAEMGGAFGMTAPAESGGQMAANVGIGATLGAIMTPVVEAGITVPARVVDGIRGALAAGDEGAVQAVKFAAQELLPLMPDDISRARLVKTLGQYIDQIDPSSTRQNQINSARKWLEDLAERFKVSDTPDAVIGQSIQRRDTQLTGKVNQAYDQARALLDPHGWVPADNTAVAVAGIQDELSKLPKAQREGLQGLLDDYEELVNFADVQPFSVWDQRRSALLDDMRQAKSSGDMKKYRYLTMLQKAIMEDMSKFADDVGGAGKAAWEDARRFMREEVAPLREGRIGKVVTKNDGELFVEELLGGGATRDRKSRAAQLWGTLDPEGRAAAKQVMVEEAIAKAMNKSEDIGFSPAKAATQLESYANRIEQFMGPDEAAKLTGYANYLRYISRSSLGAGTTGTGYATIPALVGGAAGVAIGASMDEEGMGGGLGVLGGLGGGLFLFRHPAGQRILQKMAKLPPATPAFQKLADELTQILSRQGGVQADAVSGGGW